MGFFDEIAGLIKGSAHLYSANEAFDKLIEESREEYSNCLTGEENELYENYIQLKDEYCEKRKELSNKENDAFMKNVYAAKVAYLEALAENDAFPDDFKERISSAIEEFKPAFAKIMEE